AECGHHPVDATSGRCPPRVPVDDVPGAGLVDRRDHDRPDRPLTGPEANRVEQLLAGKRLVRDDEDMLGLGLAHTWASWSAPPLSTACRAPGTPYSYGPPLRAGGRAPGPPCSYGRQTPCGISPKLNTGGGDNPCHSIVIARHGLDS